MTKGV